MALCALPEYAGQTPHNVSLVPKSKKSITNYICIEDLRIRRRQLSEDANGYSRNKPSSKGNIPTFTICTKAIHDGHYKVHDIVNFIEVNRILGAEKLIFYADRKIADLLIKQCLDSYSESGIVEIHPFSIPRPETLIFHGQIITMTECMYSVMYRTKFVINKDLDEFIVPTKENNWNQMLINIHKQTTNPDRIASYNFRNQFFPHQKEDDPYLANDTLMKLHRITTLLQTLKEDYVFPHNSRSKVMARPEKLLMWHMHLTFTENLINKEDSIYNVSKNEALLFHYRQWTTSKKLIRERRMHEFTPQLIKNIGLAPKRCLPTK